jgi:hypothetical protein
MVQIAECLRVETEARDDPAKAAEWVRDFSEARDALDRLIESATAGAAEALTGGEGR